MLYMKSHDTDLKIIVLETANLDRLKAGEPVKSPDGTVLIAWTPDPVWLADKIMDTDGDAAAIGKLIDESTKRPDKGPRKGHELYVKDFDHK